MSPHDLVSIVVSFSGDFNGSANGNRRRRTGAGSRQSQAYKVRRDLPAGGKKRFKVAHDRPALASGWDHEGENSSVNR